MRIRTTNCIDNVEKMVSLHQLINKLEYHFRQPLKDRFSAILNKVPNTIIAKTNEQQLIQILKTVLSSLINGMYRDAIQISAKEHASEILIQVQINHVIDREALGSYLQPVHQLAESLGGTLSIHQERGTTVAITFLNKYERFPAIAMNNNSTTTRLRN
jgi:hypothetical protein